jgi:hypothetical protein
MVNRMRVLTIVAAAALGVAATVVLAEEKALPKGEALLTVAGKTAHWNRGAMTPERDASMKQRDIRFERAMAFDKDMLAGLPQHELRLVTPAGEGTYSGPLLVDVLKASGAEAGKVRLIGLDGTDTELKADELGKQNWILALVGNGKAVGNGTFGPLWLMHKPAAGEMPSREEMEHWASSVFFIEVL